MKKVISFIKDIVLKNPILLEGIVIAPIVAVGVSLKNALLLSLCLLIITLPSVILSATVFKRLNKFLKIPAVFLSASLFYLLAAAVALKINPATFESFGIYLPIFIVNSIILANSIDNENVKLFQVIRNTMIGIISFALVAIFASSIREILGLGTIYGKFKIFSKKMSGILYPFSGYFIIAFLAAITNYIILKTKERGKNQ